MRDDPELDLLVERFGYAVAALASRPGSPIVGVMPLHVAMIVAGARHRGIELTPEAATSLLLRIGGSLGQSVVGARLADAAAKLALLPGLEGFVPPFLFTSTVALGAVADALLEDGGLSDAELRDRYERAVEAAKSAFRSDRTREPEAMEQAASAQEADQPRPAPTPAEPPPVKLRWRR